MASAAAGIDHIAHPVMDDFNGVRIDPQQVLTLGNGRLDNTRAGVLDLPDELQPGQGPTIGDARHGLGDLQRRGQQTALTDGKIRGVARENAALFVFQHPLVIRHQARAFPHQWQPGVAPEAETPRQTQESLRANVDAHLIEPGVAGSRERPLHIDRTLGNLRPVVKGGIADGDRRRTVDGGELTHRPFVQSGQRDDRLEAGRRRIGGLKRPAEQRLGGVGLQRLEVEVVDPRDEAIQIKRRARCHDQHLASGHIDDDKSPAAATVMQRRFRQLLPFQIERGDDRAARPRTLDLLFQQLAAVFIKQQPLHPRLARQQGVVDFFQARAAFGFLPQRLVEIDRPGRQLADTARIAQDVRRQHAVRVAAPVNRVQDQPRHQSRLDAVRLLLIQLARDQQWQPAPVAVVVVNLVVGLRHSAVDQQLQPVQPAARPVDHKAAVRIFKLPELQTDLIGDPIIRQRLPFPIHDLPAWRRDPERDGAGILARTDRRIRGIARDRSLRRSLLDCHQRCRLTLRAKRQRRETEDPQKSASREETHHEVLKS